MMLDDLLLATFTLCFISFVSSTVHRNQNNVPQCKRKWNEDPHNIRMGEAGRTLTWREASCCLNLSCIDYSDMVFNSIFIQLVSLTTSPSLESLNLEAVAVSTSTNVRNGLCHFRVQCAMVELKLFVICNVCMEITVDFYQLGSPVVQTRFRSTDWMPCMLQTLGNF